MAELPLRISNLTVTSRGQRILDDVSLELEDGAFLGLIGPNGAGKTVMLKTILGLIKPTSGTISVLGRTPEGARGQVGYVPQYARFDGSFPIKVRDVVLMGRLPRKRFLRGFSAEDVSRADELLALVEMEGFGERDVMRLSGGQLQRVLIARALALEPKLLLLDEPTASIDSKVGQSIFRLLEDLSKSMTIVLVSHDIGVIASYVKTIACLNRKLHYHHSKQLSGEVLSEVYGCPVELIAHGHAHRVLGTHDHDHEHDHE